MRYSLLCPLLILIAVVGCTATDQQAETTSSTEPQVITEGVSDKQCFRNEYPFEDNPEQKDVESLTVDIQGERVTGEYDWTPALKGARTGSFNGSISDDVITADYEYMQEGQSGEAEITIRLEPEQAVVEGGVPELGLNTTIVRVDC